jgi:hypothetical protein
MEPRRGAVAQRWAAFVHVLNLCRFPALILVAGALLLTVDQGRDLLIALAERGLPSAQILFLAVLWWAFNTWYWARVMLDFRFPDPPPDSPSLDWWRRHLPRALGAGVYLVVAGALLAARGDAGERLQTPMLLLAGSAVLWGLVFYWAVLRRRHWVSRLTAALRRRGGPLARLAAWLQVEPNPGAGYRGLGDLPVNTRAVLALATLVGGGVFFAALLAPVATGWLFGGIVLFFIAAGAWIPLGSALVYLANRSGLPVLLALLALALVFSLWNDNHSLREVAAGGDPAQRPSVDAAAAAWMRAQEPSAEDAQVLVIVATAGGGSRAAYWTATVLGQIADEIPAFRDRLFAISGVSGGSVGATVYRGLLTEASTENCADGSLRGCAQTVLGRDFLGPALAGALYPDLAQRFLPLPHPYGLPDRARALELSWEAAYAQALGPSAGGGLAGPFLGLYDQDIDGNGAWPALLLNGTWVQHGRRLVVSNLALEPEAGGDNAAFLTTHDLLDRIGRDLPASTAAGVSARFPGVGPAGTLRDAATESVWGRVVDGGYFENFGAATATELLRTAMAEAELLGHRLRPVVIQISSDPELPAGLAELPPHRPLDMASELRAPLATLFATRGAHGLHAAGELRRTAEVDYADVGGRFLAFRMCPEPGLADPPLGWTLSAEARARIDSYLPADPETPALCPENREALAELRSLLR